MFSEDVPDRGMIHIPDRLEEMMGDFITLLSTACNLELMDYFWNCAFNNFGLWWAVGN